MFSVIIAKRPLACLPSQTPPAQGSPHFLPLLSEKGSEVKPVAKPAREGVNQMTSKAPSRGRRTLTFIEGLLRARNFLWVSQRNSLANLARQVPLFPFPDEETEAHTVSQCQSPDLQPDRPNPWVPFPTTNPP